MTARTLRTGARAGALLALAALLAPAGAWAFDYLRPVRAEAFGQGDASVQSVDRTHRIEGEGAILPGANGDDFFFVNQSVCGDLELRATLTELSSAAGNGQAGIMIRSIERPQDERAASFIYLSYDEGKEEVRLLARQSTRGASSLLGTEAAPAPPIQFRIDRQGDRFAVWFSPDGSQWTQVGPDVTLPMAGKIDFGLTALAATATDRASGTFKAVSLVQPQGPPAWSRFVVDASVVGPDGVRLADINDDGRLDAATGFEPRGVVKLYEHPGKRDVKRPWPSIEVVRSGAYIGVEDAVAADIDDDGVLDVVSSIEGDNRSVVVHFAPIDRSLYDVPTAWTSGALPGSSDHAWLYSAAVDINGDGFLDIVSGGKGGEIGWFRSPGSDRLEDGSIKRQDAIRDLSRWTYYTMDEAGWIMSILPRDVDADGLVDIIVTDRIDDRSRQGPRWLRNLGNPANKGRWPSAFIGFKAVQQEVMFMDNARIDADDIADYIVPVRVSVPGNRTNESLPQELFVMIRTNSSGAPTVDEDRIVIEENVGTFKAARAADMDEDGDSDIVVSFARACSKIGVAWLEQEPGVGWTFHDISGLEGSKFDDLELIDLDDDGDRDVMTTEEDEGLGVIWYRNPRF